ncbi:glycoside hydrolase family 3 N-terminal domain-containing protein [Hymenobacter latericus]|uniref:glycoside hydrolase family 3 N-terminal domain-containing protein n=1 Tax=Hymenobacter sp. YIM 151858-1 TaxID=2987688 RepID=UPI002227EEBC|nr:glycoside hydrolase family 3 N-terminal domain-containing protein [Hymenobacter sp. YIM 151858-1]UYZ59392.1 serine hydrolase [Hymenobacter sp. YIM 151858-1]
MRLHRFLLLMLLVLGPLALTAQHRKQHSAKKKPAATHTSAKRPAAKAAPAAKSASSAKAVANGKKPAPAKPMAEAPAFLKYLNSPWVDSVMKTLTPDQRVAQLFMVAAYSNRQRIDEDSISALIQQNGIGGLIFFQGGPVRQSKLLNRYQAQSRVPLLVAMDAEWGVGMRLDSVVRFPYQMTLGGVRDNQLLYEMGQEVAYQIRRLGMHVNFAPVVDVNNNANNPVIGFRSWGENKRNVTEKSYQYMKGMQDAGVLAVAKHFPGHGDTDADSHFALPLIRADRRRLDSLELGPFRSLMSRGLGGVMIAHLNIPALDSTGMPSTLSRRIVTDMVQKQMGYQGIIFTDAMNMKGVTSKYPPGEADVRALLAGNDILEFSKNVPKALQAVRAAIDSGRIKQADIDIRCRRVLALKQWAGLNKYRPIELKNITADLNSPHAQHVSQRLQELSMTVLRNQRNLLPLQRLDTLRIATVTLGTKDTTDFQRMVSDYAPATHFSIPANATLDDLARLREQLRPYNLLLVGLQNLGRNPASNFGISPEENVLLREVAALKKKMVVSVFGSAYAVSKLRDVNTADAIVLAYQESKNAQELAAQVIFGGVGATGKLPVSASERYGFGAGLTTQGGIRLRYAQPEAVGMNNNLEARVDSLISAALAAKAFPGAEVLIARRGTVVLRKSYGTHTYDAKARPVRNTDLYDLASVTKVAAATPALMKLQDLGKFSPEQTLGSYFDFLKESNKKDLKMRDVLTHQARLKAWIPFWQSYTRPKGVFSRLFAKYPHEPLKLKAGEVPEMSRRFFRPDSSARFPLQVADKMWARKDMPERLKKSIAESPLNEKPGYVYSDLSFYLYPQLVQQQTGKPFEQFLRDELYRPLGATTLGLHPEWRFPKARIVPTEYDSLFRKQLLHGTVHDEGAALLGGLSGHAGLFGSANDLAKLVQLYAWNGKYGGQQLLKPETVQEYTKCQNCPDNRRALGFDRPAANPSVNSAKSASQLSYGHTGYTGTYFWVDPQYDLMVILLTNRVNPTRRNNKITEMSVRSNLLQTAIEAVQSARPKVETTVEE